MARRNDDHDGNGLDHEMIDVLSANGDAELVDLLIAVFERRPSVLQDIVDWALPDHAYASDQIFTERREVGRIKSFSDHTGYGFIDCPSVKERFEDDVFLHTEQMRQFQVDDDISFALFLNADRRPVAYDLAPVTNGLNTNRVNLQEKSKIEKSQSEHVPGLTVLRTLYMPKLAHGATVLEKLDDRRWRVTNEHLQVCTPFMSFRNSKNMEDRDTTKEGAVKWETVLDNGFDEGDGWVRFEPSGTFVKQALSKMETPTRSKKPGAAMAAYGRGVQSAKGTKISTPSSISSSANTSKTPPSGKRPSAMGTWATPRVAKVAKSDL